MTLTDHLSELRRRLLVSAVAIVVGAGAAIYFAKDVYHWLQIPLAKGLPQGSSFVALSPVEGWLVYFKVSLITSLFITSPIWLYQIWAFIAPGLRRKEQTSLVMLGMMSALLFTGGAFLCYWFVIPHGFQYLISMLDHTDIAFMPQMSLYFSFMLRLLVACGLMFEVPLVIIFLVKWGIASLQSIRRARPYVIISAFVLAAIITPPDVFTQIMLAIPFILLFEASLLISWVFVRKGRPK
jgi:sec-independent protein translocase protein TatC